MKKSLFRTGKISEEAFKVLTRLLKLLRPLKQKFVRFHITSDDLYVRPLEVRSSEQSTILSERAQRHTWPISTTERVGGASSFGNPPTLTRTPWEVERSSRRSRSTRRLLANRRPLPRHVFEQLPREIYHAILDQLEQLHHEHSVVDAIARQADLKSLLLVDKRWHRVAREHLYREIWLPSSKELPRSKLSIQRPQSRLGQLQRTLKASQALAYMVRHLHITADLASELDLESQLRARRQTSFQLLAEIISNCPNVEYFTAFSPVFCDVLSMKLLVPLAQSSQLRAHAWDLRNGRFPIGGLSTLLHCHDSWQQLETLVLCSNEDLCLGVGSVSALVQRLPRLQNLMLSRLAKSDFHNGTMLALPPLKALRLEHLEGVSSQGLEQLAHSRLAVSLERLSLIGLEVTSLRSLQLLLANTRRLRRFTLLQDTSPEFRPGMESASPIHGLDCPSLEYIHWDALVPGSGVTLLANSIASGRLPALSRVKVPCDYDGAVQALCRPIAQEPLDEDDLALVQRYSNERYERFLRLSQIHAQLRVRQSRQQPSFNVVVHDENRKVSATHVIGSYIGSMSSKIEYSLEPDVEGSHYALADLEDTLAPKWLYE